MDSARVRVLGPVHLRAGSERLTVGGHASVHLLAVLVAAGGGAVAATELADRIWGGDGTPATRLRMAVSRLRRRLAEVGLADGLVAEAGGYRLVLGPGDLDADVFEQRVREARGLTAYAPDRAADLLREGLALWQGPAYAPVGDRPGLAGAVARLAELRLSAEEELADADLRCGHEASIVDSLWVAADEQPLRERRWEQLAVALGALGRQSEALRAIHRAREVLRDEVGVAPGAALAALERELLARGGTTPERAAPWRPVPDLVGRDVDLRELPRTLRVARVVTVLGLGGVGKSALARTFAAEAEAAGVPVTTVAVGTAATPEQAVAAVAAAVGLQGSDDPAGLPDAIARRIPVGALWVVDGAEVGGVPLEQLLTHLLAAVPSLRLLVTSRVPLSVLGGVRLTLDPLPLGTAEDPGPAMRLFATLAGVRLDVAGPEDRTAVARVCERAAGLPLALELLAATCDQVGLAALAAVDVGAVPGLDASVGWALDALPPACRHLVTRAAQLPAGFGTWLGAAIADVPPAELVPLLAPAAQARLLRAAPGGPSGLRYHLAEPVRAAVLAAGGTTTRTADAAFDAHLLRMARAVGRLHGPADPAMLARVDDELDNVRHRLARTVGQPGGLALAGAMARAWGELGLGGEGAAWIDRHLEGMDEHRHISAVARVAGAHIRGLFDLNPTDVEPLEVALAGAEAVGDWETWLLGSASLAVALSWAGGVERAIDLLVGAEAQARMDLVGDPWFRVHRTAVTALGMSAGGFYDATHGALVEAADRFLEVGDVAAALQVLLHRAVVARAAEDVDAAAADVAAAEPHLGTGLARGAVVGLRAEAAHVARVRGVADAPQQLAEAIESLERAGSHRLAAAHRRDLAAWRAEDGDRDGALLDLRLALPTLLRTDRRGAAIALGLLAELADGEAAATLAGAADAVLEGSTGADPTPRQRDRLAAVIADARVALPLVVRRGGSLDDAAVLAVVDDL